MIRRLWWWLTPLGRVRLALAAAEAPSDPRQALQRLQKALEVLRRPGRARHREAAELLIRVLERTCDLNAGPDGSAAVAAANRPEAFAPWPDLRARAHALRARCAEAAGQWPEALVEAEAALDLEPGDRVCRYLAAQALLRRGGAGDFALAREHLSRLGKVAAPAGSCPVPLLRAACAAVLGDAGGLAEALAVQDGDPGFAADAKLLRAVHATFLALGAEAVPAEVSAARLAICRAAPGPLARAVLQLLTLTELLEDLLSAAESGRPAAPRVSAGTLAASPWAAWIEQRLRLAGIPPAGFARALAPSPEDASHPALLWERIGWRQELAALAPTGLRTLHADLESLVGSLAGQPVPWSRLVELRQGLAGAPSGKTSGAWKGPSVKCPWFPAEGVLQPLLRREARAELHYLEGRVALRLRAPEQALERFRQARESLDARGPAGFLSAARFTPVLAYWEGAAQAHLGRGEEARQSFTACRGGAKAIEAEVQLGMLALAEGDLSEAMACLRAVPEPLPGPACYLAALLADAEGRPDEARRQIDRIITAEPPPTGVYATAAWRLRGSLAEREGNPARAVELYRQALACGPADRAATLRLGRLLLRDALGRFAAGEAWEPDPALASLDDAASGLAWARPIAELHVWLLAGTGRRDLPRLPAAPSGRALRHLTIHLLLRAGLRREAGDRARTWSGEAPEDLPLAVTAAVLKAAGELRSLEPTGPPPARQSAVEGLAARLSALTAAFPESSLLAFWQDTVRLALAPELAATGELFLPFLESAEEPLPRRAFAAVVHLFAEDAARRRAAAEVCRELLQAGAFAGQTEQHDAAAFLAALADAGDDALLARYAAVEKRLETLPCSELDAYVAACEARLRAGAVDAITHGVIPDSLAELSHPDVRRVVGLAYALRATRNAERDIRAALSESQQAIDLLTSAG